MLPGLPDLVTHEKFEPQLNWRPPLFRSVKGVEKLLTQLDTEYRDEMPLDNKLIALHSGDLIR